MLVKNVLTNKSSAKSLDMSMPHLLTNWILVNNIECISDECRRFARFLNNELKAYFDILSSDFLYSERQEAEFYLVVKPKKEVIKFGPPKNMKENAAAFKEKNKNVFEKSGMLYARLKIDFSAKDFLDNWKRKNADKMQGMGIIELGII